VVKRGPGWAEPVESAESVETDVATLAAGLSPHTTVTAIELVIVLPASFVPILKRNVAEH